MKMTSQIEEEEVENVSNIPILCPIIDVTHEEESNITREQTPQPSVSTTNSKTCTIEDKMMRKWMLQNVGATLTGIRI